MYDISIVLRRTALQIELCGVLEGLQARPPRRVVF